MKPARIGQNAHAMTAERFRSAIRDIGISVDDFSFMTGTDVIDVQLWLLGHRELPKWVPSFLAAITVPEARLRASVIADRFCMEEETAGNRLLH